VVGISQAASGLLPPVPVHQVFNRLLQDMPSAETNFSSSPVSHQDVEDALQRIEMVTNIYAKGGVAATIEQDDTSRLMPHSTKELMDNNTLHVVATSDAVLTSAESKHDEPTDTNMPTSTVHTAENSVTIVSTDGNFRVQPDHVGDCKPRRHSTSSGGAATFSTKDTNTN